MDNMTGNAVDQNEYCYSVLMTVYHQEDPVFFEWAIRSMLFQTVRPDDFVIVCDGPLTPALDSVIDHYVRREPDMFQILRLKENCGSGAASRQGLQLCRNELVARMDADDLAASNRAELQLREFRTDPELAAVGGQMAEFVSDHNVVSAYRILPEEHEALRRCAGSRSPLNNITAMFRKSAALAVGNYSDVRAREDYELWIRMLSAGYRMKNVPQVLAFARVGNDMYGRRRGVQYFRLTMHTEKLLLRHGFISPVKYGMEAVLRFTASVLLPKRISYWMFSLLMRSKTYEADVPAAPGTGVADAVFQDCVAVRENGAEGAVPQ